MIRLLFIFSLFLTSCTNSTKQTDETETTKVVEITDSSKTEEASVPVDTLLSGIQEKVNRAFVQSLLAQKKDPLTNLENQLDELFKTRKQNLVVYWQAYLKYYVAIFFLQAKDKKSSEDEAAKAISLLKGVGEKNTEDYALLALMQSFSIQFKSRDALAISTELNENLKNAFALDSDNIRACYVFASNDFYTPAKYGGGKQTEKYLLKAVSLPAQKIKNKYFPSWGKEESYELLIRNYIKQGNFASAKKYYQEGIKAFPDSYIINQLAPKLVGK